MAIVATGSKTIIDLSDGKSLSVYIGSNLPRTQIKDGDTGTYSPNWASTPLVLTPSVYVDQQEYALTHADLTITWQRKVGSDSATSLLSSETVASGVLTVNANTLGDVSSGLITYVVTVVYTDPDTQMPVSAVVEVSFALVTTGTTGSPGKNAIVMSLHAPSGTVFTNQSGTKTISVAAYDGPTQITSGATYAWYKFTNGSYTLQSGLTSSSISVSGSSVVGSSTYRCVMTYPSGSSNTYADVITLVDKTDNYQAVIESTGGTVFKNTVGTSTMTCTLWQNGQRVDESGTSYTYTWYRLDADGDLMTETYGYFSKGYQVDISGTHVENKTTFICDVSKSDGTIIASAQHTIVDLSDPVVSGTAPTSPVADMLWLDTSESPSVLKRWTGSEWEIVDDKQAELDKIQGTLDSIAQWQISTELKLHDDRIIATVLESKEYTTKIESIEANLQLTKDDFNVQFSQMDAQIGDIANDANAFRSEVTSWLNFSKDAVLEIGKSDSDFKMNLSNTELAFLYKNTKMAYFGTDNGLYIGQATIEDRLTIGNITMMKDSQGRMIWV